MTDSTPQTPAATPKPSGGNPPAETQKPRMQPPKSETEKPEEIGGPEGSEPTRYGDWERKGRCVDF